MIVRAARTWALAAMAAVLLTGRAQAFPIVFNGPGGFGISAASAASAEASGVPIIAVDAILQAAALNLTIPAPAVLSSTLTGSPSISNPNRATSDWSVTNGGIPRSDVWLVFLNPVTYTRSQVGFEMDGSDGWAVISVFVPFGEGGVEYFYPAKFLGDMNSAVTVDFLMRHLIGEALHTQGGTLVLPQYSVGALTGIPLPEPGLLILAALGTAMAVLSRRGNA